MSIDVKLPDLGDGIKSGDILEVLVKVGDEVRKDQSLVEVETEKATVEVPSPQAGRITHIHVKAGESVAIGARLVSLEGVTAASGSPAASPASPSKAKSVPPASTPPAAATPSPPKPARATPLAAPPQETRPTRKATPKAAPPAIVVDEPPPVSPPRRGPEPSKDGPIPAGPAIRRFAREVGVDLSTVRGSGNGGRITREDVLEVVRHANRVAKENGSPHELDHPLPGEPAHDDFGPVSIEAAPKIRRTIAARMHESWSTVPRVTNFDDADITELEKVRQASKGDYAASGIKLTTMPFVIKAVSMSLRRHPLLNASYDSETSEIIYKRYVNVGMAVDSERGLVVPVLKNTDQLSISETARLLAQTADRVRANSFTMDDLRGGTFTISNLGAIGGTYSTPIVNIPEVAILLTGRARQLPVVVNDQVVVRLMMPLSLAYDHRLVDGATAARFLNEVIGYLEAPGRLLLAP